MRSKIEGFWTIFRFESRYVRKLNFHRSAAFGSNLLFCANTQLACGSGAPAKICNLNCIIQWEISEGVVCMKLKLLSIFFRLTRFVHEYCHAANIGQ